MSVGALVSHGGIVQLVWLAAQPPRGHMFGSTVSPVEALHTNWFVCTPGPHVTEHGKLLLETQL